MAKSSAPEPLPAPHALSPALVLFMATATGLALREPVPSLSDAAWIARAFARNPALGAKVARAAARVPLVMQAHRRYPVTPDRRVLVTWAALAGRAAGVVPDVA